MRFINCPNCFSSHSDEYLEQKSPNSHRSLNHHKFGRLHDLTKALFSPNRRRSFKSHKCREFDCCTNRTTVNGNEQFIFSHVNDIHWSNGAYTKYRLERKHKIKKRDLVKQYQRQNGITGNFNFNLM